MIFRLEIQMLNCFIDAFVEHLDRYEKLEVKFEVMFGRKL